MNTVIKVILFSILIFIALFHSGVSLGGTYCYVCDGTNTTYCQKLQTMANPYYGCSVGGNTCCFSETKRNCGDTCGHTQTICNGSLCNSKPLVNKNGIWCYDCDKANPGCKKSPPSEIYLKYCGRGVRRCMNSMRSRRCAKTSACDARYCAFCSTPECNKGVNSMRSRCCATTNACIGWSCAFCSNPDCNSSR